MAGQFHFLALLHTANSKEAYGITSPRGPHHFKLGVSRIFNGWIWKRLEWHKIWSFHEHGTIDHLSSIHFSYVWLCNWKHPFSIWPKGKSPRTLHASQALPWRATPTRCGTMWFLCAPVAQLVDQPCTTLNLRVGFDIGWSKLLLTNYKARKTSLEHNRKTKRCLAHLCLLPKNTCLSGKWTKIGVSLCFNHLGWTKPKERERAMGFQIGTTSHTKVIRLECNVLLGRDMDLNPLTWLLVTCVLFQMYTTPTLIQLACGDVTTWHHNQVHLPIFNTLHFTLNVGGRRYHVIWFKLFLIHLEVHQLLEK